MASGIDDIIIITGRHKRFIEDHSTSITNLNIPSEGRKRRDLKKIRKITDLADICYVRQKRAKGIGDAISYSRNHIGDYPSAIPLRHSVTKSKTPCTKQQIKTHEKYKLSTVAITEMSNTTTNIIINGKKKIKKNTYKITNITEKLQNTSFNLAVIGHCILTPDIFDKINETEAGFGGEVYLTDALLKLDSLYNRNIIKQSSRRMTSPNLKVLNDI